MTVMDLLLIGVSPNDLHAEWAGKAPAAGFQVIVDKPTFLSRSDIERLLRDAGVERYAD